MSGTYVLRDTEARLKLKCSDGIKSKIGHKLKSAKEGLQKYNVLSLSPAAAQSDTDNETPFLNYCKNFTSPIPAHLIMLDQQQLSLGDDQHVWRIQLSPPLREQYEDEGLEPASTPTGLEGPNLGPVLRTVQEREDDGDQWDIGASRSGAATGDQVTEGLSQPGSDNDEIQPGVREHTSENDRYSYAFPTGDNLQPRTCINSG